MTDAVAAVMIGPRLPWQRALFSAAAAALAN